MRKAFVFAVFGFLFFCSFSSHAQPFQRAIGIHFGGLDFYGPQSGQYFLQSVQRPEGNAKRLLWEPAASLSYWQALQKGFVVSGAIGMSAMQYPNSTKDTAYISQKLGNTIDKQELPYAFADLTMNYFMLGKSKHYVHPYVKGGVSLSIRQKELGAGLPLGLGIFVPLTQSLQVNVSADYRLALTSNTQAHFAHLVGLTYTWNHAKTKQTSSDLPMLQDADNDGIADKDDLCPSQPGKKEMKGCPDKDADGLADKDDDCPEVKGPKATKGCPDTDGDGLVDSKDDCPDVPGLVKYKGCPIPDRDRDGFNDEVDKCPEVASKVNSGCPEVKEEVKKKVEMAAKGVNFETGSATISSASFGNLDKIVDLLKAEPTYLVDIEGHTDNIGKADDNLQLSQNRADACKQYLVKKGIEESRISSVGYGDMRPIADNDTEEGRAKNRRTEFNIRNH